MPAWHRYAAQASPADTHLSPAAQDDLAHVREVQASLAITDMTPTGRYRLPGLSFSAGPRRVGDPIGKDGEKCAAKPLVLWAATAGPMLRLRPRARTQQV
jgi:hypothetical protein